MKQLFAYIRVSTAKQGLGVSLQEQRSAIERYASHTGAELIEWFDERKTAAKAGRPEFARMVKLLRQGKAQGVVIHKIDRSTRNYRDWADIDELIEDGVEVHFANDDLDLTSRGGRLAADIQVVVAVDYIRNLREEALKGIHGRLKQGILPHHAPIGYFDKGAGKPKEIDPIRGPLIRQVFELYATGAYTLRDLTGKAENLGLRNSKGNLLRLTQIHATLRNVFYAGVIRSARFGVFTGAHEPIVKRAVFDRVQEVLDGKIVRRTKRHQFPFRRLVRCASCGRSLIGSQVKGRVYYRCSTMSCPTTSLREDDIDAEFRIAMNLIRFDENEAAKLQDEILARRNDESTMLRSRRAALTEALAAANARLTRLADLLIDGKIEVSAHDERRHGLIMERHRVEQELQDVQSLTDDLLRRAGKIVELAKGALNLYERSDSPRKRRLLEIVMSNCAATGKKLDISLREPFATIAKRIAEQDGRAAGNRTLSLRTRSARTTGILQPDCGYRIIFSEI